MASVLVIMVAVVGTNTVAHLQDTRSDMFGKQARYAARAGIQAALAHLNVDPYWSPVPNPLVNTLPGQDHVSVKVQVYNNYDGALGSSFTAPDGIVVPRRAAYVIAVGSVNGRTSAAQSCQTALAWYGQTPLNAALFGNVQLALSDSFTDSWESVNNAATMRQRYADPQTAKGTSGSVGTNGVSEGVILRRSRINGNVLVGTGAVLAEAFQLDPESQITGNAAAAPEMQRMQAFKPPASVDPESARDIPFIGCGETRKLGPGAYTTIDVPAAATLQLSAGTYYVRDALKLSTARLIVTGPVELYVGGEFSMRSSSVNPDDVGPDIIPPGGTVSGLPSNLRVFMCGDGTTTTKPRLTMEKGSGAWMVVAGRNLIANISASHLYGAFRGDKVTVSGGAIHYDTTLARGSMGGSVTWTTDGISESKISKDALHDLFGDTDQLASAPGSSMFDGSTARPVAQRPGGPVPNTGGGGNGGPNTAPPGGGSGGDTAAPNGPSADVPAGGPPLRPIFNGYMDSFFEPPPATTPADPPATTPADPPADVPPDPPADVPADTGGGGGGGGGGRWPGHLML